MKKKTIETIFHSLCIYKCIDIHQQQNIVIKEIDCLATRKKEKVNGDTWPGGQVHIKF